MEQVHCMSYDQYQIFQCVLELSHKLSALKLIIYVRYR